MLCHIAFDGFTIGGSSPANSSLHVLLTDGCTLEVIARQRISRASRLQEITLRIRNPRAGIYRISQFLVVKTLASDVDYLEPIQLLRVRAM